MAMRRAFQLAPRLWQQGQQGLAPVCNAFAHGAFSDESLWTGASSQRAAQALLFLYTVEGCVRAGA